MPQATTLRLHRGPARPTLHSASAFALIQAHMTHVRTVHTIASRLAADAELLVEALRYFNLGKARGR